MWAFVWIFLFVCLPLTRWPTLAMCRFPALTSCPAAPSRLWWDYGTPSRCLWPTMTPSPLATPYWKSGRSRYDCITWTAGASPRWPWTPSRWLASRTARRITTSAPTSSPGSTGKSTTIWPSRWTATPWSARANWRPKNWRTPWWKPLRKPSTACAVTDASTRAARPTSSLKRRAHPTTAERHGGVGNGSRALYVFVP